MNRIKHIIIGSLLLLPTSLFAKKEMLAHVTGKIEGYSHGNLVIVIDPQGKIADDTLQMSNDGKFKTSLPVEVPTELIFSIEQPQAQFKFYVTPGSKCDMDISLQSKDGKEYEATVNYIGDNKEVFNFMQTHDYNNLVGSKYNDEAIKKMKFPEFRDGLVMDVFKMKSALATLKDKQFKAAKEAEWTRKTILELFRYTDVETTEDQEYTTWMNSLDFNNDLDVALAMTDRYYRLAEKSKDNNYEVNFIKEMPRRFLNLEVYYEVLNQHMVKVFAKAPVNTDQIFATYKKLYAGHEADIPDYVKQSYAEAQKNVAGKMAPDFEMEDINGKTVKLSDLRGKTLYIDIWATWCGPCKAEIPNMVNLVNHYREDENVQIVSISIDQNFDHWKTVMSSTTSDPKWLQYHVKGALESELCKQYNVVGIPRFILIDRDGKIVSLDAPRPSQPTAIELIDQQ